MAGIPPPAAAHAPVPEAAPIAEADLPYRGPGVVIAVFLDGAVHDGETVAADDRAKRAALRDKGYQVVTIRHDAVDDGIAKLKKRLHL